MNNSAVVVVCCSVSFLVGVFVGWKLYILKLNNAKKRLDYYESKAKDLKGQLLQ